MRLETADVPRPMLLGEYFGELQLTRFPESGRQAGPVNSESGNGKSP